MSSNESKNIKRKNGLPWQILDGQSIILATEQKAAHELNEVGTHIWHMLDGENSTDSIAASICSEFEVSPQMAKADLNEFVTEMRSNGLLE